MDQKVNDLVKIHNDVNQVAFTDFNKRELSIFYSIAEVLDDKGEEEMNLSFSELKKQMKDNFASNKEFIDCLQSAVRKMLSFQSTIKKENGNIVYFVPFIVFEIQQEKKNLRIRVNPEYLYLFNMLTKNFTAFELRQFHQLGTKYSQRLFTLLMQFRATGRLYISVDDFRRILDVPEAYPMKKISTKILEPALNELRPLFPKLTLNKIKTGKTITHLEFTFSREKELTTVAESETLPESEKIFCPHCGKEMIRRTNKETGATFYGHRVYKHVDCQYTYGTREELEADWQTLEANKEKLSAEKEDADKAWEKVLRDQQTLFSKKKE